MDFSDMSKQKATQLIEAKIVGEQPSYSSIVNEAVRMIKDERERVRRYESSLKEIMELLNERDEELLLDCEKILDKWSIT